MDEVRFVELISCKKCKREMKMKTLKEKQLFLKSRINLMRCYGCDNLIDIADELKGVKNDNKKN